MESLSLFNFDLLLGYCLISWMVGVFILVYRLVSGIATNIIYELVEVLLFPTFILRLGTYIILLLVYGSNRVRLTKYGFSVILPKVVR